ncbi:LOW QUALITY PROTEIN: double-stranded RNA-binding protein Staufen homolog 1-like [Antechinus flavipes]|uniref:LOW QUALITY PROTEIN: double-stranded RNA-binding protein Staufen homolog 1-like n=1 Tax=Antechinus flavipes TaxID=38775 RepID=UPI0022367EB6|nr:LOW QUALITY PROTEIN: double-stranded RNA-binding protein Staufen homolog 1-like [Antechinus flavipes]
MAEDLNSWPGEAGPLDFLPEPPGMSSFQPQLCLKPNDGHSICTLERRNPDSVTPTVELNALCMKLGKKTMYKPVDPYTRMQSTYNYNMRGGAYPPRYFYPFPVPPLLYQVELSIGGQQFNGKGRTRQAAKHDAAAKALKILQNEPLPEKPEVNGREPDDENLNKSEISQVFEIALKRNLPVNFEVTRESGPPHMKSFVTKVSVGEFMGEGEGKSKKISKKNAAIAVLEELKKLPPLPTVEKMKPRIKKKTKSIVKLQTSPEYGQGMNPISRLAQIQQAKKDKEPEYMLLTERGLPRRREFVIQVKVGGHTAEGMGLWHQLWPQTQIQPQGQLGATPEPESVAVLVPSGPLDVVISGKVSREVCGNWVGIRSAVPTRVAPSHPQPMQSQQIWTLLF